MSETKDTYAINKTLVHIALWFMPTGVVVVMTGVCRALSQLFGGN